jgi:hypothetical protein
LWHVHLLLGNNSEKKQLYNSQVCTAIIGINNRWTLFSVWSLSRIVSESQLVESRQLGQWVSCNNMGTKKEGIIENRHQATTGEDTLRRPGVSCSDLWNVVTCCFKDSNKSDHQSKPGLQSLNHVIICFLKPCCDFPNTLWCRQKEISGKDSRTDIQDKLQLCFSDSSLISWIQTADISRAS